MATRKKTTTQPKPQPAVDLHPLGYVLLNVVDVVEGGRALPLGLGDTLIHWSELRRIRDAHGSREKGAAAVHTRDGVLFVEDDLRSVMSKIAQAQQEERGASQ